MALQKDFTLTDLHCERRDSKMSDLSIPFKSANAKQEVSHSAEVRLHYTCSMGHAMQLHVTRSSSYRNDRSTHLQYCIQLSIVHLRCTCVSVHSHSPVVYHRNHPQGNKFKSSGATVAVKSPKIKNTEVRVRKK